MKIRYSLLQFIVLFFMVFSSYGQKYKSMTPYSTEVVLNGINDNRKSTFENYTKQFLDAINLAYTTSSNPVIPKGIAKNEVNETIGDLWAVSPFFSVDAQIIRNLLSMQNGNYQVRFIQMVFEEAKEGYEQQDAVIIFDNTGKIIDFKIALGYHSINTILRDTVSVTDLRRRQMIISFVEDFRTAYNLKDINYIDKVFSDKAIIITGKVLNMSKENQLQPIKYKVSTKSEYLSNLKTIFNNAKMIDIKFDSVKVVRHPSQPDIYGVNLYQTWNAEYVGGNYKDLGYVFLMIDFIDENEPKIWVRAWDTEDFYSLDAFPMPK